MPAVTFALALIIFGSGVAAGGTGALLGIGGAVFVVPLLHITLGFPLRTAAAIGLTTVIATSSSVSAHRSGQQLINLRLGMVLEVTTVEVVAVRFWVVVALGVAAVVIVALALFLYTRRE